jgi:hypothetical protein
MGSIILTGISHGKHQFSLTYPEVDGAQVLGIVSAVLHSIRSLNLNVFLPN